jgi:hypothetical protein
VGLDVLARLLDVLGLRGQPLAAILIRHLRFLLLECPRLRGMSTT